MYFTGFVCCKTDTWQELGTYQFLTSQEYAIDVPESVFPMTELLTVRAVDVDAQVDFGSVRYAVRGEGEDTFVVDPVEGHLMVRSLI